MSDHDVDGGRLTKVFSGRYGRYILPAVIFQSVLMGGGYSSGREVVQFGARFGTLGVWTIVVIFVGFTGITMLAYEFSRVTRSYNYRSFMRKLLGPIWPVFDVLWIVMAILTIAVMASAAGEIGNDVLGLPYLVGVLMVIALVAVLEFYGRSLIEGVKSVGTLLILTVWIVLGLTIVISRWEQVSEAFAGGDTSALGGGSFLESPTVLAALVVGVLYVSYNLPTLTTVLFSLDRQRTRRDALLAGLATGVLAIVPFILTYLAVMSFYPSEDVLDAPVPWLAMTSGAAVSGLAVVYGIVVIYTLVETATGFIHALVHRINGTLADLGRSELTRWKAALFSGVVLAVSALLAQVGIIDLVSTGYTAMAFVFLALLMVPLLTIGLRVIVRASHANGDQTESAQADGSR